MIPLELIVVAGAILGAAGLLLEITLDGAEFVMEGEEF